MNFGIQQKDWDRVFSIFSHFPHIQKAILFGSRAKGTHKPYSDVDIALEGTEISLHDLLQLKTEIDDLLLPYEFDFCIFHHLKNADLVSHIRRRGQTLYVRTQD